MNLIYQLRNLFTPRREAAQPAPANSCKELLSNLDQLCARLPEGEALLITGDGEFTVRLTWKPQTEKPAKRTFSLNGHNEAVEWIEDGTHLMSAADIYAVLKKKNPAALKDCSCTTFSRLLAQMGRRVHTRYGNGYWVKRKE